MEYKKQSTKTKQILSTPFIWVVVVPLVILDLFVEFAHHVSFPLLGIPLVDRGQYIRIDRYKLKYLSRTEKLNCAYCGYANGLIKYTSVVIGELERYWCGIKHESKDGFTPPAHHEQFVEHGDESSFIEKY